jgi:UDP-3-O-[3-hydroxymyristoyl] glucosamine N-acyltransferase
MDNNKQVKASEIAEFLGAKLFGNDIVIKNVIPISTLAEYSLSFAKKFDVKFMDIINQNPNSLIICTDDYKDKINSSYIISDNPRLDFLRVIEEFFAQKRPIGIDQSAKIDPQAKLGKDIFIGSNSVIGPEVTIGDETSIHHNVVILGNVTIGKRCVIKSGAILGEEGFGFEYNEYGVPEHFPHIGSIEIGDEVWIGAGSTVERATIDKTIIKSNVKVDDLVQVGHNCIIEENTLIMAGAVICGGATVGRNCWIAPNSSIKEKVRLEDNVLVGLGAVVIEDVPSKTVVVGNPAKKLRDRI